MPSQALRHPLHSIPALASSFPIVNTDSGLTVITGALLGEDAKVTTVSHHPTSEKLQGWGGSTKVKVLFVCAFVRLICCDPAAGHTGLQMQAFLHLCSMNLHHEWLTDQSGILDNLLPALHKEL